jgi:hypothetical protein
MTKALLAAHVLAAILVVGPIAVAASLFPRFARPNVLDQNGPDRRLESFDQAAALLHRICRGYAVVAVIVPVFGIATGAKLGVLLEPWLLASVVLTVFAAAILWLGILPGQQRLLGVPSEPPRGLSRATTAVAGSTGPLSRAQSTVRRLMLVTGVFNLLWAAVVVLMIIRPGSTTGV